MQINQGMNRGGSGLIKRTYAARAFLSKVGKPASLAGLLTLLYIIRSTPLAGPPAYLAPAGVGSVIFALLFKEVRGLVGDGWAQALGIALGMRLVVDTVSVAVFGVSINAVVLDPLSAGVGFLSLIPLFAGLEAARVYLIRRGGGGAASIIGSAALVTLILVPYGRLAQLASSAPVAWIYLTKYLIPSFSVNIVASELARWWGLRPALGYTLLLAGAAWLSPYLPSLPWFATPVVYSAVAVAQVIAIVPDYGIARKGVERRARTGLGAALDRAVTIASLALLLVTLMGLVAGYRAMVVVSGSMEPSIQRGDIVVSAPASNPEKGDVIAYAGPHGVIVHRVIDEGVGEDGEVFLKTKGDANSAPDPWEVPRRAVIGRVVAVIPYLGYPIYYLSTLLGGFTNAMVAIIVFSFFSFYFYVRFIGR